MRAAPSNSIVPAGAASPWTTNTTRGRPTTSIARGIATTVTIGTTRLTTWIAARGASITTPRPTTPPSPPISSNPQTPIPMIRPFLAVLCLFVGANTLLGAVSLPFVTTFAGDTSGTLPAGWNTDLGASPAVTTAQAAPADTQSVVFNANN